MQLTTYDATEIYYVTQEGCIFWGNMYNDTRKVMGVVPGHALLVGKVTKKGETIIYFTFHMKRPCRL